GLLLDGPFRDQSEAVAQLSGDVISRMKWGTYSSIVGAAIATLAPQNLPSSECSWLKVPFIVTSNSLTVCCDCAGSVANVEASLDGARPVRAVDMEGLTLVGVAVLRRLGLPAFFSFMHFDKEYPGLQALRRISALVGSIPVGEPVPSIVVLNPEPEILSLLPPYVIPLPTHNAVAGFEILDDSAVLSLMRLKMAYEHSVELMRDIAAREPESEDEGALRAVGIGHTLHEGISLWSEQDARRDLALAAALLNPKDGRPNMESIRLLAEGRYIHNLLCPVHQSIIASEMMLSDKAKRLFSEIVKHVSHDNPDGLTAIPVSIRDIECVPKLMAYLALSELIREHVHTKGDCEVTRNMN
ncbi:MAG: hypothetical protein V1861_06210, partial [Candidatus Micrarchaeota archaeon]